MKWDRDKLLLELSRFSFAQQSAESDELKKYQSFYGMDFRQDIEGLEQRIGWIRNDDYHIVLQTFQPPAASATVFLFHGYFDHAGLYSHLIRHLLAQRYTVVIYDQPGHGLSSGPRAVIDSFQQYQNVLKGCLAMCEGALPKPFHAIGQSTGGAVLIDRLLNEEADTFDKVVLLAPLIRPRGWTQVRLLHFVLSPFKTFMKRSFSRNSDDSQFLEFLKKRDPLQSKWLSVTWVGALKKWIPGIESAPKRSRKLLVIQGRADLTVGWRTNIPEICRLFSNVKIAWIETGRHHLVNESAAKRKQVFALIDSELSGL
jgi:alpha-beta hydrolase superfamily lysophospholipase